MTNVISVAFTKGHIKQPLKESIEAFQIKLNNKRKYLAFYIRKSIHNCYDAMTTSPCEFMNRHIKHTSKATTLNNTRWVKWFLYEFFRTILFLMLSIYEFIYIIPFLTASKQPVVHCYWLQMVQMIAYLQWQPASRELQLSIINSKLPCKNLFHRKCVFLLHDQFDGRKKQKCVCYFHGFSLFIFYLHFPMMIFFHASCRWCMKYLDGLSGTLSTNHHTLIMRT